MAAGGVQHPVRDVLLGGSEEKHWEDGWNGLLYVSDSRHPVGGGIRTADDRRGIILPGETESDITVFGVQGEYGIEVTDIPPIYAAR